MIKYFLLIFISLSLEGCATIDMYRTVGVNVSFTHINVSRSETNILVAGLFHNVADQLGFTVTGPIRLGEIATIGIEYTASAPSDRMKGQPDLTMLIDDGGVHFVSSIYGTKEDLAPAWQAVYLFEEALKEHGIRYEVSTGETMVQGGL